MFKSDFSGRQSENGEKPIRLVVETRERTYVIRDERDRPIGETTGFEIVREIDVLSDELDAVEAKFGLDPEVMEGHRRRAKIHAERKAEAERQAKIRRKPKVA